MQNSSCICVENIWLEIIKNNRHYIIGGIYRHPNQLISEFHTEFESVLNIISSQKTPCFVAGDFNIDLTKCDVCKSTAEYVDMLFLNNFVPTVVMPTRITSRSATLIDHMYFYQGSMLDDLCRIESGNFLNDLSDHLPNYTVLVNEHKVSKTHRPLVRIFSRDNKENFAKALSSMKWDTVYSQNDVNLAYNNFASIISNAFNQSFPLTRLSRKRTKYKIWVTTALKKVV